jgi:hypothetical protein
MLISVPCTITEANAIVKRWHRHHRPTQGGLFAVACAVGGSDEPCGVAIVGRPVSRMLDDGWHCEVTRVATDGTRNACSFLYGRARKAAFALGYKRVITYTLPEEGGASLRAAGFVLIGEAGGGKWTRENRPGVDMHPTQPKFRWESVA